MGSERLLWLAVDIFHCFAVKVYGWTRTDTYDVPCAMYRRPDGKEFSVMFYLHAPETQPVMCSGESGLRDLGRSHIRIIVMHNNREVLSEKGDLPVISDRYWDFVTTLFAKLDSHAQ